MNPFNDFGAALFYCLFGAVCIAFLLTWGLVNQQLGSTRMGPAQAYPDSRLTPGLIATTNFTELTAVSSCGTYSQCHRLTTSAMKTQVCKEYPSNCKTKIEIDHFCPLALGCADDVKNLWAEPEHIIVNGQDYGFHVKDRLETFMVSQMKAGKISPNDAQQCILKDWVACMKKYLPNTFGGMSSIPDPDDDTR